MPVYKVPVTVLVEAATEDDAMMTAIDGGPGRYILGQAERPGELSSEEGAAVMEWANEIEVGLSYELDDHQFVEGFPGVKFSPGAAATLRSLRGEADHGGMAELG